MSHHSDRRAHCLYRFYGKDSDLLYIGITATPNERWKQHSKDKPWWEEVENIAVDKYRSRQSVLEAERNAIIEEKPKYNIVHNQKTSTATIRTPQTKRSHPFQVGDWIAACLSGGRCPVGMIAAFDDEWLSIRLVEFLTGSLTNRIVAVRWGEIERTELAYLEDAEETSHGSVIDDKHLGELQSAWTKAHFLEGESDAVEEVRKQVRQEILKMEMGINA